MSFRPQYKATPPTLTEGQFSSGLLDVNGNLKVAVTGGSASTVAIDQTTPGTTNGVVVNSALPAGTNIIGNIRLDQTTPGTTNGVVVNSVTGNVSVVPGSTETKITAATIPAGGVGFVGWLSAIWYQLTQVLTTGGTVNTTLPTYTNGQQATSQFTTAGRLLVSNGASYTPVNGTANAGTFGFSASGDAVGGARALAVNMFKSNGTSWDMDRKPSASSRIISVAATTNATVAKASAGDLYKVIGLKATALPCYLKIYNKATAPTVGTDVPVLTIPLNASSLFDYNFTGMYFSTGISYAITLLPADNDTTAVAAADILGLNIVYA